jgi:hypothetical protein
MKQNETKEGIHWIYIEEKLENLNLMRNYFGARYFDKEV